jgi:D-alanyl-D-alanine carboxypeptidase
MTPAVALSLVLSLGMPAPVAAPRPAPLPMPPISSFPVRPPPAVDAVAWMAWSVDADSEIGSANADRRLAPASITKLLTAILTVEHAQLADEVVISVRAASTPLGYIGQPALRSGEVWNVGGLLENIMVQSGNDAAVALGERVSGSLEAFIELMNRRAGELGMTDTVFVNPHGLDAEGQLSTARDLIRLGMEGLRHPAVTEAARIKQITFLVGNRRIPVTATNRDLGVYPGYLGLKTGDTASAGQVLLSYLETPRGGILAVVLGSTNRRQATRDVVAWASTARGPRDHFYGMAAATDAVDILPSWYRMRIQAAGELPVIQSRGVASTPLLDDVHRRLRELLPDLLGGSR